MSGSAISAPDPRRTFGPTVALLEAAVEMTRLLADESLSARTDNARAIGYASR
jgi:hypothetical protein